jgi:ABC-type transport system involved in multi-copper enzyme maturation permease subunit
MARRMRNVWIVARREFRHYFVSPIAYAVALFLFVVLGILFYVNVSFGLQQADLARQPSRVSPDGHSIQPSVSHDG